MTPTIEVASVAIACAVLAAAAMNLLLRRKYRRLREFVADTKSIKQPPREGEWVRFLVAQPELEVEIGDRAQIRYVRYDDDVSYVVRIDTRSGRTFYTTFLDHESWQLEVIR